MVFGGYNAAVVVKHIPRKIALIYREWAPAGRGKAGLGETYSEAAEMVRRAFLAIAIRWWSR